MKLGKHEIISLFLGIISVATFSVYFTYKLTPDKPDSITIAKRTVTTSSVISVTDDIITKYTSTAAQETKSTSAAFVGTKAEKTISTTAAVTSVELPTEEEPLFLDINTASADELSRLPGIGEVLAASIVAYREENGAFLNIEQIMEVDGIGEFRFGEICGYIYVEDPVYPEEELEYTEAEPEYTEEPETEPEEMPTQITTEEAALTLEDIAPIELNSAEVWQLELLPHVTDDKAEEIIALREAINGFSHPYELLLVESLEQWQVAEMIEYVYVE